MSLMVVIYTQVEISYIHIYHKYTQRWKYICIYMEYRHSEIYPGRRSSTRFQFSDVIS